MIILGLGTNLGDRLANLRAALRELKTHANINVQSVSPVYASDAMLPKHTPLNWQQPFFNAAVVCSSDLKPLPLLKELKKIETTLGRIVAARWAPRIIDIDILMWDDVNYQSAELSIPHPGLLQRPFVLWPLMDLYSAWDYPYELITSWGSRFSGEAPFHTRQVPYRIDGSIFVGVLNITPDSFSDGDKFFVDDAAVAQAKQLFTVGAEIIDIGAESTRPNSQAISVTEEWQHLQLPLQAILDFYADKPFKPKISIDTRNYQVVEKALAIGVDWINDVNGLRDPRMFAVLRDSDVQVVCMHSLSVPPTPQMVIPSNCDPVAYLLQWGSEKLYSLQKGGIATSRIILDIGIGFGKTPEQSLTLIKRASEFKQLGVPIMVGHARKSFHKVITDVPTVQRDLETAISTIDLFSQGIDYIRVHEVAYNARAVAMQKRLDAIITNNYQDPSE